MSILCALSLALPALAALPQDHVQLVDGSTVMGKIASATLEGAKITSPAGEESFPAGQVLSVRYGPIPAEMEQGEAFLSTMEYQNASNAFAAAAASTEGGLKRSAELRRAEALLAWSRVDSGQAGSAVQAFQDWVAAYPDDFLLIRARLGLGQALAAAGKVEEAAKELEGVATLAFDKNLAPNVEFEARYRRCQAYLSGGQAGVAEARLRDLVPKIETKLQPSDTPAGLRPLLRDLLSRSQILLGDAIEAKDGMTAAKAYWESLTRDPRAGLDVRAAATVGLARAAKIAGEPRRAQILLAKVVATMPASPEVSARALYALGDICEELKNRPVPAKTYYRILVEDYPSTSWAVRARAKLGE